MQITCRAMSKLFLLNCMLPLLTSLTTIYDCVFILMICICSLFQWLDTYVIRTNNWAPHCVLILLWFGCSRYSSGELRVYLNGQKKQQALMNQATCIVLIHQQHSLAHEEKRTFDDMMIIDTKLSKKLI